MPLMSLRHTLRLLPLTLSYAAIGCRILRRFTQSMRGAIWLLREALFPLLYDAAASDTTPLPALDDGFHLFTLRKPDACRARRRRYIKMLICSFTLLLFLRHSLPAAIDMRDMRYWRCALRYATYAGVVCAMPCRHTTHAYLLPPLLIAAFISRCQSCQMRVCHLRYKEEQESGMPRLPQRGEADMARGSSYYYYCHARKHDAACHRQPPSPIFTPIAFAVYYHSYDYMLSIYQPHTSMLPC